MGNTFVVIFFWLMCSHMCIISKHKMDPQTASSSHKPRPIMESIATTAIAAYAVHRAMTSTPTASSPPRECAQFACYLTKEAEWKCKLFYHWKEAAKYVLDQPERVASRYVPISMPWLPKPVLTRILKHNLSLPVHTFYADDFDLSN